MQSCSSCVGMGHSACTKALNTKVCIRGLLLLANHRAGLCLERGASMSTNVKMCQRQGPNLQKVPPSHPSPQLLLCCLMTRCRSHKPVTKRLNHGCRCTVEDEHCGGIMSAVPKHVGSCHSLHAANMQFCGTHLGARKCGSMNAQ